MCTVYCMLYTIYYALRATYYILYAVYYGSQEYELPTNELTAPPLLPWFKEKRVFK